VKRYLADEAATIALGEQLFAALPPTIAGLTLLLEGDLGAGKSTLARALIRASGHTGAIPSPTYTLVEPYRSARGSLYHIDLYRISSEDELRFLGWNELDDGCRLVEWPERVPGLAERADLRIQLSYEEAGRRAEITALSDRGEAIRSLLSS
jgi:tRNA threonylcarbamoyladenosine biosynthesis protein TsaE